MSEEQKQDPQHTLRINANIYSTEETLNESFNNTQLLKELTLSIISFDNLAFLFSKTKEFLSFHSEITTLSLEFENIKNLDFENSFYLLKDFIQLTNIQIRLININFFNSNLKYSLEDCLKGFVNLTSLSIQVSGNKFQQKNEKFFSMTEVYKSISSLNDLKLTLTDILEDSFITSYLFEGINQLKNLKSLDLSFYVENQFRITLVLDCLEYELRELTNLSIFSIDFGWNCYVTYYNLSKLGQILKKQQQLENLKIMLNYTNTNSKIDKIGLEDCITSFSNLKYFSFTLKSGKNVNLLYLVDSLSKVKSLEKVILDLCLSDIKIYNNKLQEFGKSLAQIEKLSGLKMIFYYYCKQSYQNLIQFLSEFKLLKSLKVLSLYFSQLDPPQKEDDTINLYDFHQVIQNLDQFYFNIADNCLGKDNLLARSILEAVQDADNLEELNLKLRTVEIQNNKYKQLPIQCLTKNKKKLKNLTFYAGSQYQIEQNQFKQIFEDITQNNQLKIFSFQCIRDQIYSYEFMKILSDSLTQLNLLTDLDIQLGEKSIIDKEGLKYFFQKLQNCKVLKAIEFEMCKDGVQIETLDLLYISISSLSKLKNICLRIKGQKFDSKEDEMAFGNCFKFPSQITTLRIDFLIDNLKYKNIENFFKQISQLRQIHYLDLVFDQLLTTNSDYIEIRKYLSNLKLLKHLVFKHFQFSTISLFSLFQDIENLEDIELESGFKNNVSSFVYAQKNIKYKSNIQNQMDNKHDLIQVNKYSLQVKTDQLFPDKQYILQNFESIAFTFQNLKYLNKLKLDIHQNNCLGPQIAVEFFKNIIYLINLKKLNLKIKEGNQIGEKSLIELGQALIQLPQLQKFKLVIKQKGNKINWFEAHSFVQCFSQLTQLQYLEISITFIDCDPQQINDQKFLTISIFENVKYLSKLKQLKIKLLNCTITEDHILEIFYMLDNLKFTLRSLDFKFDKIPKDSTSFFLVGLQQLEHLQKLKLQFRNSPQKNDLKKLKRLVCFQQYNDWDDF